MLDGVTSDDRAIFLLHDHYLSNNHALGPNPLCPSRSGLRATFPQTRKRLQLSPSLPRPFLISSEPAFLRADDQFRAATRIVDDQATTVAAWFGVAPFDVCAKIVAFEASQADEARARPAKLSPPNMIVTKRSPKDRFILVKLSLANLAQHRKSGFRSAIFARREFKIMRLHVSRRSAAALWTTTKQGSLYMFSELE
jgi:hypothetical protein